MLSIDGFSDWSNAGVHLAEHERAVVSYSKCAMVWG